MKRLLCWLTGHEYRWLASDRTSECRRCGWCQIHETRCGAHPRTVTVTLTCDTSAFVSTMSDIAWHLRLSAERQAARAWWAETRDAAWARYGWQRPTPRAHVVWWRPSDVDEHGNVRPVAVATLGEPQSLDSWEWLGMNR